MSYFEQYNLNIQNEIKGILLEAGYAGSRGVHLPYGAYNLNAIPLSQARPRRAGLSLHLYRIRNSPTESRCRPGSARRITIHCS